MINSNRDKIPCVQKEQKAEGAQPWLIHVDHFTFNLNFAGGHQPWIFPAERNFWLGDDNMISDVLKYGQDG